MPISDDIKEQHSKLEGKGFKYKLKYYWEYYRWPTFAVAAGLFIVISLIVTFFTAKDTEFQAVFVNCFNGLESEPFAERIGVNPQKYNVTIDANYTFNTDPDSYNDISFINSQKITAMISANTLDVIVADEGVINFFGRNEALKDLRVFFGKDYIESLGDKVIWATIYKDELDHSAGSYTIPVAVDVSDAPKLVDNLCFPDKTPYFSVIDNTSHSDYAYEFYNYIYDK